MLKYLFVLSLIAGCSQNSNKNIDESADFSQNLTSNISQLDLGVIKYKESIIKSIYILNDQSINSDIVNPVIVEPSSSNYSIVYMNNCNKSLKPQEKCLVKIQVSNKSLGGTLSADLVAGDLTVNLTAQAEVVNSESLVFKSQQQIVTNLNFGTTSSKLITRTIQIMNNSKINKSISAISLSNNNFQKVMDSCSGKIIPSNQLCQVIISFNPIGKIDQSYSSELLVDSISLSLNAQISGGVSSNPEVILAISEKGSEISSIDFSNNSLTQIKTIFIKNKGNVSSSLSGIVDISSFKIIYSSCDNVVLPNKTCSLKIMVEPSKILSGNHIGQLTIGSHSIPINLNLKPIISLAELSGPINNKHNDVYYTSQNLGQEIIPLITATTSGNVSNSLTYKYSLFNDCSNSAELSSFIANNNQSNSVYVQAEDSNSVKSDCVFVGNYIHDNIIPSINYNISSNYTIENPEDSSSKLYSFTKNVNDSNLKSQTTYLYSQANCMGTSSVISDLTNINVAKLNYVSIKTIVDDFAGNINELCSPSVYLTEPILTSIEFDNNPSLITIGTKLQSKKIIVKDQYNQKYTKSNVGINITTNGSNLLGVTTTAGEKNIYLTNNSVLIKSGVSIVRPLQSHNQIELSVQGNPSIFKNQSITAYRKNCSELKEIDLITTSSTQTIDFDEEGPISPETVYCFMDASSNLGWTLYASYIGNTSFSSSNTIGLSDNKYLVQTSFDSLRNGRHSIMADFNGGKAFALNSDIPQSGGCQNLNNSAPSQSINSDYVTYGHSENSGCNGDGGDYTLVAFSRAEPKVYVDGYGPSKFWRTPLIGSGIITNAYIAYDSSYMRMYMSNYVYLYPQSCSEAVNRDPSLLNTGSISVMIDRDGLNMGAAPITVTCDTNFGGGVEEVVVNTLRSGRYLNAGSDYGAAWGSRQAEAVAFCNDKGIYTAGYAKITGTTGSSQVYSFTAIPGSIYAGHVANLPNQVNVICGKN